jgi:hypothetical protein
VVIAVNAIEVTVEQNRQVLSVDRKKFQVLEVGKGDDLVLGQYHFLMVYLEGDASFVLMKKMQICNH